MTNAIGYLVIVSIGDDFLWGSDLAELANACHFEFNKSTNVQNMPKKQKLGNPGTKEIDEISNDNDSEVINETNATLMNKYDIDINYVSRWIFYSLTLWHLIV